MRTNTHIKRLKETAKYYGIQPELAWLMTAHTKWDSIKSQITELNRNGMSIDTMLDLPIQSLRHDLLILDALLKERKI